MTDAMRRAVAAAQSAQREINAIIEANAERSRPMEGLPPELLQRLKALWQNTQPIQLTMQPRDAWTICAIVQFASRNPALSAEHTRLIEDFGRQLQAAITRIDPALNQFLEMGWHPEYDQERS